MHPILLRRPRISSKVITMLQRLRIDDCSACNVTKITGYTKITRTQVTQVSWETDPNTRDS